MSIYGVTDIGFKRKPKTVILEELKSLMKAKFGQDLDVDPESPEGQMLSVIADAVDPLWEVAEHSYNAYNPTGATGVTLENLALLNSITRKEATSTTVDVTWTGTNGVNIPAGTVVSTDSSLTGGVSYKFTILESGIVTAGTVILQAEAIEKGAIQIPINSVILMDNPITGITSITNIEAGNAGRNLETDPELRSRRTSQVAISATATVDAIRSNILNIDTVISTKVYENDTAISVDYDGVTVPPHAIKAIIQGSETAEEKLAIGQIMFERKCPGISTDGLVSQVITDSQGFDKTFKWDNPTLVPIYITVDTNATVPTALPNDGQEIRDAIMAFINDPATGYKIGDEVSYARLFTPINTVPDHFVQALKIGIAPSPTGTIDLNMDGKSLAFVADPDNDIVINITY